MNLIVLEYKITAKYLHATIVFIKIFMYRNIYGGIKIHIEPLTVNQFFTVTPQILMNYENKKTGLSYKNIEKSCRVPNPKPSTNHFTTASRNSMT